MLRRSPAGLLCFALLICIAAVAQTRSSATRPARHSEVSLTVVDENGVAVGGAQVIVTVGGAKFATVQTDYRGHVRFPAPAQPYELSIQGAGFYVRNLSQTDPTIAQLEISLARVQQVREEVNVVESPPEIDPTQTAITQRMDTAEIVNVPYPTSRDIRNVLPFNPGVVQDVSGQVHVAGAATYETLDLLDGFNIRSPVSGILAMRFSADAVRSIEVNEGRYPVEFGQSTAGVVSFRTGMGNDTLRFNATNFIPSFRNVKGLTFDKFVPRATVSGPIVKGKAWFFDGVEGEFDNVVIKELPDNADSAQVWRGSNLAKAQVNVTPVDIVNVGFLVNGYRAPYEGLSANRPRESTEDRNTAAWLAYGTYQHTFDGGTVMNASFGQLRFRDAFRPQGSSQLALTPEGDTGSFFETLGAHSQRTQGMLDVYLPPRHWAGTHDLRFGVQLNAIAFDQKTDLLPVNYLREDGTLLRRTTFGPATSFERHNFETGVYAEDRWMPFEGLLVEPGVRFDYDDIVRRPLVAPRLAATYSPGKSGATKFSAGVGLYYGHTQLGFIANSLLGPQTDTFFAPDGLTPTGAPVASQFVANYNNLRAPRSLNWSAGVEQRVGRSLYLSANFIQRREKDAFAYESPSGLSGVFTLANTRTEDYDALELTARRVFANGYNVFAGYTRSRAKTNRAVDYGPVLGLLGQQGAGALPWDVPNRFISWGWLPVPRTKRFDFVYTLTAQSGFAYSAVDAARILVGTPNSRRFPTNFSFSPGLEWRFHVSHYYLGLRAVVENITSHQNPLIVNNVVASPFFGTFSQFDRRTITARIRIIGRT